MPLLNALRYDVKGRRDIGTPYKFCFEDVGVRNVASDFRDLDETDIIENIVFNEIQARGFRVVEAKAKTPQKDENSNPILSREAHEVDFVIGLLRGLTRSGRRAKNTNPSAIRWIRLKKSSSRKGKATLFTRKKASRESACSISI